MQSRPRTTGYEGVSDYIRVLRRRRSRVLYGFAVAVVLTAGYVFALPHGYSSTTSVLVIPSTGNTTAVPEGGRTRGPVDLDTEAQLVKSSVVAERARALLRSSSTAKTLISRVSVTVPPNTDILEIAYRGSSPAAARRGSLAFAQAYLNNRLAGERSDIQAQVNSIRSQVLTLTRQLHDLTNRLATLGPRPSARALAESQRSTIIAQLANLTAQLGPLQAQHDIPGSIVSAPSTPVSTRAAPVVLLESTVLGGLLLGIAWAAISEQLATRIETAEDVKRLTGEPPIADLPAWGEGTAVADAYRRLAARVLATVVGQSVGVVGVTDTEGVVAVARGLTDAMRDRGDLVALVDASRGRSVAEQRPAILDESAYLVAVLPPVGDALDPMALVAEVDRLVLVVERGATTRRQLAAAIDDLDGIREQVLGVVVVPEGVADAATDDPPRRTLQPAGRHS